ncbi:MAG: hypothetical protein WCK70_16925 [Chloroflexales bacterium]|jgi:pimeloyl-ACP methyl ester carboxylesterase
MRGDVSTKASTPPQLEMITRHPDGPAQPTPLLFVHGAWHGAWCWELFLPYFAGLGYTLGGHGWTRRSRGGR